MGIEIALIIAITAGVMSLVSGGVSIGSFFHFKKKFSSVTKDTTTVDITNKMVQEDVEWGHRVEKTQEIHIEDIDFESVNREFNFTRTGLPNKTAETLANGAAGALRSIAPAGNEIELLTLPNVSDGEDQPVLVHRKKHHQKEKVAIEVESEDESLDLHRGAGAEESHVSRHKHLEKKVSVSHEESSGDELEASDSSTKSSNSKKHHHKKKVATKKLDESSATNSDNDEGDSALSLAKLLESVTEEVGDILGMPMVADLGLPAVEELVGTGILGELSGSEG